MLGKIQLLEVGSLGVSHIYICCTNGEIACRNGGLVLIGYTAELACSELRVALRVKALSSSFFVLLF